MANNETRPCYVTGKKATFHRWNEIRFAINEAPMVISLF